MIEFNGYISGSAEKRFIQKSIILGQNILLITLTIFLPGIIFVAIKFHLWLLIVLYGAMYIIFPLAARIPQSKKEQKAMTPKKIYVEEGYIICITDKHEETKSIEDVEEVIDWGEFYELVFPFGNVSNNFMCQKDLLTTGTLEEFEALFEDKITRK